MGNGRSKAQSVHAFPLHNEEDDGISSSSRMYEEPLLQQTRQEEERYGDILHKRSFSIAQLSPVNHNDKSYADEKDPVDLGAMIHQLNSYYAVFWHVSITMICASLVACYVTDSGMKQAMRSYMYYQDIDDSSETLSQKSMLAFCNALIVIGFIACLTFIIVLMYKFNCMQLFLGYCIFYSTSLLGMAGAKIFVLVLCNKWHWVVDIVSLSLVMYNFAVVGVLSIFYRTGIPLRTEQAYLVCTSVIVAWQLAQLPEWSVWMILFLLAFWDLFAVMAPIGPLRCLVDLIQEKGTPLPGLLFQADVADAHVATQPDEDVMDRSLISNNHQRAGLEIKTSKQAEEELLETLLTTAKQQQSLSAPASSRLEQGNELYTFHQRVKGYLYHYDSIFQHRSYELSQLFLGRQQEFWQMVIRVYNNTGDAQDEDRTIKLGLGDFIFYSVLVARAATHGIPTFLACFVSILVGLGVTMHLLARFDALPALPISIFLSILTFLLTWAFLTPFVVHLTSHELW